MIRLSTASLILAVAATLVAAAGASSPVTSTESAVSIQPGDQSHWSLDFSARMEQTAAHPIEIHLAGGWTSTVSAVRPSEYDTQLELADLQFTGDALKGASPATLTAMQTRLSRPFWATYRNDGELIAMHFLRDVTASDRNLLQMIATELQFVRPDDAQQSWTAQERDGAGEYSAQYESTQPDRIVKHKVKYLYTDGVSGAPANAVRISVNQSDIGFTMGPDRRVQSVDGANRMSMILSADKSQQLQAVTEFHLSHLQAFRAPELIGSLERAQPNIFDSPIVTQRPDASVVRAESDDRLLTSYTTEAILTAAFAKDPGAAAQPDRLTALFRSRSDAAAQAASLLIENGSHKNVTNALGAAGSESAVSTLNKLAHDAALPENLRVDAILAFVQLQHPSVEAMHVPSDLLTDSSPAIQSAARLLDGALAHTGRLEHPAEADAIDAALLALYRNARDAREKADLIAALGNSAGPAAVKEIEQSLKDPTVVIRAASARALRLASGSDVDQLLATSMLKDSDPIVRADAIFATRFRRPLPSTLLDALQQAASSDPVIYVRSDALALLGQNLNASPHIAETITRIAESDADAGIRRQARDALQPLTNSASAHP